MAEPPAPRPRWWWQVVGAGAVVSVVVCGLAAGPPRRAGRARRGRPWSRRCGRFAVGRPVLADEPLAETLAQAGRHGVGGEPDRRVPAVGAGAVPRLPARRAGACRGRRRRRRGGAGRPAPTTSSAGGGWVEAATVDGYVVLLARTAAGRLSPRLPDDVVARRGRPAASRPSERTARSSADPSTSTRAVTSWAAAYVLPARPRPGRTTRRPRRPGPSRPRCAGPAAVAPPGGPRAPSPREAGSTATTAPAGSCATAASTEAAAGRRGRAEDDAGHRRAAVRRSRRAATARSVPRAARTGTSRAKAAARAGTTSTAPKAIVRTAVVARATPAAAISSSGRLVRRWRTERSEHDQPHHEHDEHERVGRAPVRPTR